MNDPSRRYGIRRHAAAGRSHCPHPHLLGADWSGTRWYDSAEARDAALEEMRRQPPLLPHRAIVPSVELTTIDP